MRSFAVRRLAKNGNSLTVAIPRVFVQELGLVRGTALHVIFDDEAKSLTIVKAPRRSDGLVEAVPSYDVRPLVV